jgi:hypothetical protein
VLLATLAGIGRTVVRDAVEFVRPRSRTYAAAVDPVPRQDPLVQQVVGQLSAWFFTAESAVLAAAERTGHAAAAAAGTLTPEPVDAAEVATYQAQLTVIDLVLRSATTLFEVRATEKEMSGWPRLAEVEELAACPNMLTLGPLPAVRAD